MSEPRLEATARAKVNLFLHVGTKRSDGFHALSSWVAFTEIGDRLTVEPAADDIELTIDGVFAEFVPLGTDNLVLRAAYAMRAEAEGRHKGKGAFGASLHLEKSLPIAAGIGGGSADSAATLHLLNELWGLKLDGGLLMEMGASLGSDVSACVYNRSALVGGRGETVKIAPDLPPIALVLVNPGVPVSTAEVFAKAGKRTGVGPVYLPEEIVDAAHLANVLKSTVNDLEEPALAIAPVIGDVLKVLRAVPGSLMARLSGSGATCYAIFADDTAAQTAAIALKRARPAWWVAATRFDC